MFNREITVHLIGKSEPRPEAIREWLDTVGAGGYEPPLDELTGAETLVGLAAKRCYMSFEPGINPNVVKVRKDWTEYLDNILASGHGSVLEHATFTFAIEGVTRVFTAEMNRHRAGVAISEGSLRYIRFDSIPWWLPPLFRDHPHDDAVTLQRKLGTRIIFEEVFNFVESKYRQLCTLWELDKGNFTRKKLYTSAFRRIVPLGVSTGGVWTLNVRALRHVMAMRASEHAEEEIAWVFSMIGKLIVESEPRLFGDFTQDELGFWRPKYAKV